MSDQSVTQFLADARGWLDLHLPLRKDPDRSIEPGDPFSTAVFHALTFAEEEALLSELRAGTASGRSAAITRSPHQWRTAASASAGSTTAPIARLESEYDDARAP